ncbi:MAG: glycosyltransferase family 2 protein [Candidatus Uhrbacteria bacterium]
MYRNRRVSIVFPAYNEEPNIRRAIEDFFQHPAVDEIIAVDNRSTDKTKQEIQITRAKYVYEEIPGYGSALMRGMKEATGDLIVTVEPDGTFMSQDLEKLLIYSDDFDVVFGTRTSRSLIWSGAYMPFSVRMGNWAVAKFLEYLFNGPSLTDVGCTYKLIKRTAYEKIKDRLSVNGSHFSPDFMLQVLRAKISCVEIPVHYGTRIGESKITGGAWRAAKLGFRMIWFILYERLF